MRVAVRFNSPSEGGRAFIPSLTGRWYRPHFVVPGDGEMLGVEFIDANECDVSVGEEFTATVRLLYEGISYAVLQFGTKFEIREGRRVVGSGRVTEKLDAST